MTEDKAKYRVNLSEVPESDRLAAVNEMLKEDRDALGNRLCPPSGNGEIPADAMIPNTFHDSEEVALLKEIRQLLVDQLALQWRLIQTVENAHIKEGIPGNRP